MRKGTEGAGCFVGTAGLIVAHIDELKAQLEAIERAVDAGSYRPGTWARLLKALRARPRDERRVLADAVSLVSNKLHRQGGRKTISVAAGITLELIATAAGLALVELGLDLSSNVITIVAGLIWTATIQPLAKMAVGYILGVRYEYFYLFGLNPERDGPSAWYEPHAKMLYGTYLAAPRASRILLHLSGCVGSPLALWACARMAAPDLRVAWSVCTLLFWAIVLLNATLFVLPLFGITRLGGFFARNSSGGMAAAELREALAAVLPGRGRAGRRAA